MNNDSCGLKLKLRLAQRFIRGKEIGKILQKGSIKQTEKKSAHQSVIKSF